MELDFGIIYCGYTNRVLPIGHITMFGLEIGYPVSVRFQVTSLLWGQRGITYIRFGFRF